MMSIDFGKLFTLKKVLETLKNSFIGRNRILFAAGLTMLGICVILGIFFKKKLKKRKWTKRLYHIGWLVAFLLLILSLTAGEGIGLGMGDGSGLGVGDGAGAGIGDETGTGTLPKTTFPTTDTTITVRIHNHDVIADEQPMADAKALRELLTKEWKNGMQIVVRDEYADNAAFLWVKDLLQEMAVPFTVETIS